jgi:hypothetical protein
VEREVGETERTRTERKNKESETRGIGKAREIKKEEKEKSRKKSLVSPMHCIFLFSVAGNKCNDAISRSL